MSDKWDEWLDLGDYADSAFWIDPTVHWQLMTPASGSKWDVTFRIRVDQGEPAP